MKVASWNVRGLNGTRTQSAVVHLLKKHRIDVMGILETKIEELEDLHHILVTKFGGWRAAHNFDLIIGGRIVVIWNPHMVDLQVIQRHEQFIHCSVVCTRTQVSTQITFIYGLYTVVTRRPLWYGLEALGRSMLSPWVCLGDFNAYLRPSDKTGGNPVTAYMGLYGVSSIEPLLINIGLLHHLRARLNSSPLVLILIMPLVLSLCLIKNLVRFSLSGSLTCGRVIPSFKS